MTKKNKKLLMYAAFGAAAYYFFVGPRMQSAEATVVTPLPTDSMAPGVMPAAVQGLVKDGQGLSYLGTL